MQYIMEHKSHSTTSMSKKKWTDSFSGIYIYKITLKMLFEESHDFCGDQRHTHI